MAFRNDDSRWKILETEADISGIVSGVNGGRFNKIWTNFVLDQSWKTDVLAVGMKALQQVTLDDTPPFLVVLSEACEPKTLALAQTSEYF